MHNIRMVWLLFKVIEGILSFICCFIHISCFENNKLPHIFFHCATYGGFFLIVTLGLLSIICGERPSAKSEGIIATLGACTHFTSIFITMALAEFEIQLMFLTGSEEAEHKFYQCSRLNSIVALLGGATYSLHACLALDVWLSRRVQFRLHRHFEMHKTQLEGLSPIKLYFISIGVENILNHLAWFRKVSGTINIPA